MTISFIELIFSPILIYYIITNKSLSIVLRDESIYEKVLGYVFLIIISIISIMLLIGFRTLLFTIDKGFNLIEILC